MAEITYYVALPFVAAEDGVVAGDPAPKQGHVEAVAFSRSADPASGDSALTNMTR